MCEEFYGVLACLRGSCAGSIRKLVVLITAVIIMFGIGPMVYNEYNLRREQGGTGGLLNRPIPPMNWTDAPEKNMTEHVICDRIEHCMATLKYDRSRAGRKAYRILLCAVAAEAGPAKSKKGTSALGADCMLISVAIVDLGGGGGMPPHA